MPQDQAAGAPELKDALAQPWTLLALAAAFLVAIAAIFFP
jgi:hypothetical protein